MTLLAFAAIGSDPPGCIDTRATGPWYNETESRSPEALGSNWYNLPPRLTGCATGYGTTVSGFIFSNPHLSQSKITASPTPDESPTTHTQRSEYWPLAFPSIRRTGILPTSDSISPFQYPLRYTSPCIGVSSVLPNTRSILPSLRFLDSGNNRFTSRERTP